MKRVKLLVCSDRRDMELVPMGCGGRSSVDLLGFWLRQFLVLRRRLRLGRNSPLPTTFMLRRARAR